MPKHTLRTDLEPRDTRSRTGGPWTSTVSNLGSLRPFDPFWPLFMCRPTCNLFHGAVGGQLARKKVRGTRNSRTRPRGPWRDAYVSFGTIGRFLQTVWQKHTLRTDLEPRDPRSRTGGPRTGTVSNLGPLRPFDPFWPLFVGRPTCNLFHWAVGGQLARRKVRGTRNSRTRPRGP